MGFDAIDRQFRRSQTVKLECLGCGRTDGVEMRSSMTAYYWEGAVDDPGNPNAPWPGCPACWEEHHAQMRSQWDDYYAGLL